jgi:hypothetical protein
MSSNPLHITRSNYEEFFLLYVDGELSPEQCDAVEAFTAIHPDLQEELDILLTTRLDAETISFDFDKESLMAESMKANAIDENLLLYIDNELEGKEKAAMEHTLATDPVYQYQHQLLLQTKLPAENIIYPNKQELYRKTTPAIRPVVYFRAAAAVFAVGALGFMWWMSQDLRTSVPVAVQAPVTTIQSPAMKQPAGNNYEAVTHTATDIIAPAADEGTASSPSVTITKTTQAYSTHIPVQEPAVVVSEPVPANSGATTSTDVARVETVQEPQQIINRPTVTTPTDVAYNAIETATNRPAEDEVAVADNNEKRGSVKGFLRKATRLIERRTGINPTNDDEELLIGAMAIKLK